MKILKSWSEFLAHNLPDLVCYLVGPVVIFIYLMTVNIPLALISLVPLILAVVVMGMMFRNTDDLMERANRSITTLNSVMIEYISGMKLIKAYNMGANRFKSFQTLSRKKTPCGMKLPGAWGHLMRPLLLSSSVGCC